MSNLYKDNHPISSTKNAPTVNTKIEASPYQKKKKKNRGFAQETELFFILFYFIFIKKKGKRKRKRKEVAIQRLHLTFTKKNKL